MESDSSLESPRSDFIKEIKLCLDVEKLQDATTAILNEWDIEKSFNQFSFIHRDLDLSEDEKVFDGCGSLKYRWAPAGEPVEFDKSGNLLKIQNPKRERDFKVFNSRYKQTYFFHVYQAVKSLFDNIGRMRLMCLFPQTCYSWHFDKVDRLIVPIFSNEKCQFVIEGRSYFLPPNGNAFLCKTKYNHTAFNSDPKMLRTQLVFDVLA